MTIGVVFILYLLKLLCRGKHSDLWKVIMFIISGIERDTQTDYQFDKVANVGIDRKINLTSNLVVGLTLNTDFAQVEADQERVNLTRYSLYFPEKRDFFLEGAEIVSTSSSMRFRRRSSGYDPVLFYSRTIGIEQSHQVPSYGEALK